LIGKKIDGLLENLRISAFTQKKNPKKNSPKKISKKIQKFKNSKIQKFKNSKIQKTFMQELLGMHRQYIKA
jgi:hypothetical protein